MQTAYLKLLCRLHRNRVQRAILVVAALSLMPIVPALAQHPSGVAVVFHAQLPLYKLSPTAEQEISSRAAKSLAEKLPYWQYKAGGDTDFPQLRVEVLRENSGKLLLGMSLMLAPAGTSLPAGSWKDALFAPGDFLLSPVLPKEPEAPKFFSDAFEQRILSNAAIVRGLLIILSEAVPLGRTVVLILPPLNSDSPRAVLPIECKDHCHEFAESEFVILSRTTTNEKVKLFTAGISQPLDYKPDLKEFSGVGVQVNFFQKAGDPAPQALDSNAKAQVVHLTPIEFHLKEGKAHFASCDEDSVPAPSVAP